jgi:hypothetical protein
LGNQFTLGPTARDKLMLMIGRDKLMLMIGSEFVSGLAWIVLGGNESLSLLLCQP